MIKDRVVFVLGAGASVPFGFPTGAELVRHILDVKKTDVPDQLDGLMCKAVCDEMKFDLDLMVRLQVVLQRSQVGSIDEFLAQPSHGAYIEIGRFLIAAFLLPKENWRSLFEDGEGATKNWYKFIWAQLREYGSIDKLSTDAHVSFVTFNYDRSLEHYLFTVLENHLGAPASKCKKFLEQNIFHVHGLLGSYRRIGDGLPRRYIPDRDLDAIKRAMNGIKIVHEVQDFPRHAEIRQRLEEADRVVFVGFQYQRDNLNKLFRGVNHRNRKVQVLGSSYGLSPVECSAARKRIAEAMQLDAANIKIGGSSDLGCYDYLRENFETD